jgi:hypothetical protein
MTTAPKTKTPRSRWLLLCAVVVVIGVVVAVVVWLLNRDDSDNGVPYKDAAATGVIGLCDSHGKAITSGSTKIGPFVWRAVGATAAPAKLAAPGRTATLYAFQPRPGVDPSDWSGEQLTASARYTNPAHPMAQATAQDLALNDFLIAYPPRLSGLIQLRLYLGAPDQPLSTASYDATDIKVSGSSWRVVRGGTVSCTAGSSESLETLVKPTASR